MGSHTLHFLIGEGVEKRLAEEAGMAFGGRPPSPPPKKKRSSSRLAAGDDMKQSEG